MNIELDAEIFAKKISAAAKALPSKPILPWQGALRLTVEDSILSIQGIDPDAMLIKTKIPLKETDSVFDFLIHGPLIADLCKDLPKGNIVLDYDNNQVQIKTKTGVYKLPIIVGDYPSLGEDLKETVYVNYEAFTTLVSSVSLAAAKNDANFSNIKFDFTKESLEIAATDRYRLGYGSIVIDTDTEPKSVLINSKLLDTALKTAGKEQNVKIGADSSYFYIENSDTLVKARLSGGSFPNFKSLLDKEELGTLTINSKNLQESLKRVGKFSPSKVNISIEDTKVVIQTRGEETGSAYEEVESTWDGGKPLSLNVNPSYVIDALNSLSDAVVTIKPTGQASMMKIEGSSDIMHLVMPLRD